MTPDAHTQSDINNLLKNSINCVKALSDNIAIEITTFNSIPNKYWKYGIDIFEKTITVLIDETSCEDKFFIDKIRGSTSNINNYEISILGLSKTNGRDQKFYTGMSESKEDISVRISHVIIHEMVHILQKIKNREYFITGYGAEATKLGGEALASEKNNASDKVEKYLLYLECKSEMEAHSAQLAAEMFLIHGKGLSKEEYNEKVKSSDLYNHIIKKDDGTCTEKITNIINCIIENSWIYYAAL